MVAAVTMAISLVISWWALQEEAKKEQLSHRCTKRQWQLPEAERKHQWEAFRFAGRKS